MREILFRAKRKNLSNLPKEEWWVEGYYCYHKREKAVLPEISERTKLNIEVVKYGKQEADRKTDYKAMAY